MPLSTQEKRGAAKGWQGLQQHLAASSGYRQIEKMGLGMRACEAILIASQRGGQARIIDRVMPHPKRILCSKCKGDRSRLETGKGKRREEQALQ